MLGWRQVTPGWVDDPLQRQDKIIRFGRQDIGSQEGGGGAGPISIRTNKLRSLGLEWSMSEVGTPPPHNSYKPRGLGASIHNNNNNKNNNYNNNNNSNNNKNNNNNNNNIY